MDRRQKVRELEEEGNALQQKAFELIDELIAYLVKIRNVWYDVGFYTGLPDEEYEDDDIESDED